MQKKTKKNMLKRAMALSCAFALSLAPAVENVTVNAQTNADENTVSEQETQETDEEKSVVSTQGLVQTMATANVTNEKQLRDAIPQSGSATIVLKDHMKISSVIKIPKGVSVTIKSDTDSNRVIGADTKIARLFLVEGTATFNNITLKGGNGDSTHLTENAVLAVDGGTVNLKSSKIMLSLGVLVRVGEGSKVTATDTVFTNSKGTYKTTGGAIFIQSGGTFTMNGTNSKITSNPYGGVHVFKGGTFNMNAGVITDNKGGAGNNSSSSNTGKGGGVFNNGTFNFNGGTIKSNHASECGNNIFNMNTMNVKGGVSLESIYLQNNNITFIGAPLAPITAKLGFSDAVGTKVASCGSNVNAGSCLSITDKKITFFNISASPIVIYHFYVHYKDYLIHQVLKFYLQYQIFFLFYLLKILTHL